MPGVPDWSPEGIIPPIEASDPVSAERSPYVTSPRELVERFSGTEARARILKGLLEYRAELRAAGIQSGFQWLNGSFMENVETVLSRDPRDLDVVTFFHLPDGTTQAELAGRAAALFDRPRLRRDFHLDAYFEVLGNHPERLVNRSAYWYSVWAHQRDSFAWKGFVELNLSDPDDEANRLLATRTAREEPVHD